MELCWWCGHRQATDSHHLFRRSTSPQLIDDKNNLVRLCRICHDYATNQKEVEELYQRVFFLKQDEPELTVEYISDRMRSGDPITPRDVSRFRSYLAGAYENLNDKFVTIDMQRPFIVEKLRQNVESDKRAEVQYEMTDDGQLYKRLKATLKSIEKLLSSLRSVHEQYVNEAKNNF